MPSTPEGCGWNSPHPQEGYSKAERLGQEQVRVTKLTAKSQQRRPVAEQTLRANCNVKPPRFCATLSSKEQGELSRSDVTLGPLAEYPKKVQSLNSKPESCGGTPVSLGLESLV